MNTNNQELFENLTKLAFKISKPFCYHCYEIAPTGRCQKCHSDDLMRHLDGVGVEYGTEWIVESLLESLSAVDSEDLFEQYMDEVFCDSVIVCGFEMDQVRILKEMDPVAWRCMRADYESSLYDDSDNYFTIDGGSTYYNVYDVEKLIEDQESELEHE